MNLAKYKKSTEPLRQRTLCFLLRGNQVLLGLKKSGFGKGNWLGIGGKVEDGETLEEAMVREMLEEIEVQPLVIKRVATLNFYFPYVDEPHKWNQQVCAFTAREWLGEISETSEIMPQWFNREDIPLDSMWDDAQYWLPRVLQGENLTADFLFDTDLKVKEYKIRKSS